MSWDDGCVDAKATESELAVGDENALVFADGEAYYRRYVKLIELEKQAALDAAEQLSQQVEVEWQRRSSRRVNANFEIKMSEDWMPQVDDMVVLTMQDGRQISAKVHSSDLDSGSLCTSFEDFSHDPHKDAPWENNDTSVLSNIVLARPCVDATIFKQWREALNLFVESKVLPKSIHSVILGQARSERVYRPPPIDPSKSRLTKSQLICVTEALSRNLTIIQGPPGTGKSTVAVELVLAYVAPGRAKSGKRPTVLVTASSNAAADHLATNLHKAGLRVLRPRARRAEPPTELLLSLTFENLADHFYQSKDVSARVKRLREKKETENLTKEECQELYGSEREAQEKACASVDVVCTTSAFSGRLKRLHVIFAFVIVDEAAQATELDMLLPFTASAACSQLVLIGDHQQLRPVIKSRTAAALKLGISPFERLLNLDNEAFMLTTQFRMHKAICAFPSQLFYDSKLETHRTVLDRESSPLPWLVENVPVIIMHCSGREDRAGVSIRNIHEAKEVLSLLQRLKKARIAKESIAVITPYQAQRKYIQDRILHQMETTDIRVASVDSMQGSEADYIIVSTVRSNAKNEVGFLSDRRRFNVTLTRARLGVFVVCNIQTISATWTWHAFLAFFKDNTMLSAIDDDEEDEAEDYY